MQFYQTGMLNIKQDKHQDKNTAPKQNTVNENWDQWLHLGLDLHKNKESTENRCMQIVI